MEVDGVAEKIEEERNEMLTYKKLQKPKICLLLTQ